MTTPTPVPFSEPPWLCGLPSPYYKESHKQFQKEARKFISKHLLEHALEWDRDEQLPEQVFEAFAKHGWLLPSLPAPLPISWLKKLDIKQIGGVKVEDFDYLHASIYMDEVICHSSTQICAYR